MIRAPSMSARKRLKRWSTVTRVERATAELVHVPGMGEKKHPALQLRD